MSHLDDAFRGAAQLPFAARVVTADSELALEWIHQINMQSASALVVTLASVAEREGKRVGVKIVGRGESPGVLTVAAPSGQLIEGDDGTLAPTALVSVDALGVYREYGCVESAWRRVRASDRAVGSSDPATHLATVDLPVEVESSAAPIGGDVLTANSSEAAEWLPPTPANALALEDREPVYVTSGPTPAAGDRLTAVDATHAQWLPPAPALALALDSGRAPVLLGDGMAPVAGDVLTATGPSAAVWQAPSGGGLTANQLASIAGEMWSMPVAPHARDIEFSSEVLPADLVWANSTMTPITPLNNEALTRYSSPTSLPRYKVHTQRRPSWLQWQTPKSNSSWYMHCPYDLPVGGRVQASMYNGLFVVAWNGPTNNAAHNEAGLRLCIFADAAGKPDANNYVYAELRFETSPNPAAWNARWIHAGRVLAGTDTPLSAQSQASIGHSTGQVFALHRVAADQYDACVVNEAGAYISLVDTNVLTSLGPSVVFAPTPKHIGIRSITSSDSPSGRMHTIFGLDYLRVGSGEMPV